MGCGHSKKKNKGKKGEKNLREKNARDDAGTCATGEQDVCLQKQLERFEWQLRILKEVLSANGSAERAELLKEHGDEDVCALVLNLLDKVKTETTADLNVLHEQKSQSSSEEHERQLEELQKNHEREKSHMTEKFREAENILQAEGAELREELQVYNELKRRAQESTFKKDLQRNIQAHGSPGAFWESEQESLVFVIEMKSERVQEQNRKLQQLDQMVERSQVLSDLQVSLLQQNEDLRVRVEKCQSVITQFSGEQQELKAALERQVSVNQRLSQEKEQLMFKLRHRDSGSGLHLPPPTMMQELMP